MGWRESTGRGFLLDGLSLVLGEKLGRGMSRRVYVYDFNRDYVVKLEERGRFFQNVCESEVWDHVKDAPTLARWFAPVARISSSGGWLIMQRTHPVTVEELRRALPKVPKMFTDLKASWGRIGKQIVCHDYGTILTPEHGLTTALRKADWYDA